MYERIWAEAEAELGEFVAAAAHFCLCRRLFVRSPPLLSFVRLSSKFMHQPRGKEREEDDGARAAAAARSTTTTTTIANAAEHCELRLYIE